MLAIKTLPNGAAPLAPEQECGPGFRMDDDALGRLIRDLDATTQRLTWREIVSLIVVSLKGKN
jgi:hypothetical protein